MKQSLFRTVRVTFDALITANTSIGGAVVAIIGTIFGLGNWVLASVSRALLVALDRQQYEHISTTLEQRSTLNELELLKAATRVKEDAIGGGFWTASHTIAMNRIGTMLHHHCGWEPARIHGYLRQVVESIPGMSYVAGDEFEAE